MQIIADSFSDYIRQLPEERQMIIQTIVNKINSSLPSGFEPCIQYGMLSWTVPLSIYPKGYHCTKDTPLPFLALASQKNFIAIYHMVLYAHENLYEWFVSEYPKHSKRKLDMGKSCVRFKKLDDSPIDLIGELCSKMTVENWIAIYESKYNK